MLNSSWWVTGIFAQLVQVFHKNIMAKQKQKINKRLIVVSNRLPIVISKENDQWGIQPGSGGLVTALTPILKENESLWVGWPGTGGEAPIQETA